MPSMGGEKRKASSPDLWLKSLVLTLLTSFSIEIAIFLFNDLGKHREYFLDRPHTFHTVWELAALAAVLRIVYSLKVKTGDFLLVLFIGTVISSRLWLFVPDSWNIPEPRYYGVEYRPAMASQRVSDLALDFGFVYHKESAELKEALVGSGDLERYAVLRNFLTWRAGLAYGFLPDPLSIPQFNGFEGWGNVLNLYLTVGPFVLLESLARGLNRTFPVLLLAQLIFFSIRREHFWWMKNW